MKMIRSLSQITLMLLAFFAMTSTVQATVVGPVSSGPGGGGFVGSSGIAAGSTGGKTWNFGGYNSSLFTELYWAVWQPSAGLDGSPHAMAFDGISGNKATWKVTSPYTSAGGPGDPPSGPKEILLIVEILSGSAGWVTDASVGVAAYGAVVDNSSGGAFSVNLKFLVNGSPLNDYPQPPPGGQTNSSVGGQHFYVAASVPEPGSLFLLSLGLLGFGIRRQLLG